MFLHFRNVTDSRNFSWAHTVPPDESGSDSPPVHMISSSASLPRDLPSTGVVLMLQSYWQVELILLFIKFPKGRRPIPVHSDPDSTLLHLGTVWTTCCCIEIPSAESDIAELALRHLIAEVAFPKPSVSVSSLTMYLLLFKRLRVNLAENGRNHSLKILKNSLNSYRNQHHPLNENLSLHSSHRIKIHWNTWLDVNEHGENASFPQFVG